MVGVLLVESSHHLLEGALIVGNLAGIRKSVGHAHSGQVLFQFADEDVPQRHGGGPDLSANYLELASNPLRSLRHLRIVQRGK